MTPHRMADLCNSVEALAFTLEELDASTCRNSATAVLLRMELAALTTELIATRAIERARRTSVAVS